MASILYPKPCDCKGLNGLLCFRAGHLTVPFGLRSAYVEYPDTETEKLQTQLALAQAKVTRSLRQPKEKQNIAELIEKANQDEAALLALARHLRTDLEVKDVTLDKILAALPEHSGLLEYRLFISKDFKRKEGQKLHVAALLLLADSKVKQRFVFHDLGSLADISENSKSFYNLLLSPFDEQLKSLKQIYIAPDIALHIIPFASLRLPDGRFLSERQQINRLQTGRDLLKGKINVHLGKGLVAIGGIDYGKFGKASESLLAANSRTAQQLRDGIAPLKQSGREAQTIGEIFKSNTGESPQIFLGKNASEYTLKNLKQPPRILHLSTHGFYLANEEESKLADEAPLLLSGLALAGANNGLQGKLDKHGDDGLLYSLEVLGLNLQGTELVSLSACDTGKGVMDYSEGVYGLVRAFRTAGAQNVLMTLTPVGDKSSREFMETFYDNWLGSTENISPAQALHQTRLDFINHTNPAYRDPAVWSPYVLVGK
ncbi:MAG: CHAT domain-containing protein [Candidatus Electrothrix sp. MAN1_4]|nr:CHAT domain-containing protein [Candidatus Electrothrix sp. MAN1_4]